MKFQPIRGLKPSSPFHKNSGFQKSLQLQGETFISGLKFRVRLKLTRLTNFYPVQTDDCSDEGLTLELCEDSDLFMVAKLPTYQFC